MSSVACSLRGPLGLALGFYRALVQRLDVARLDCKHEPGAIDVMSVLPIHYPCVVRALSNAVGQLQTCGMLVSLGFLFIAGPQVAFEGDRWWR